MYFIAINVDLKNNYMKRQEYWLEKGYTKEQIENHLSFERYKAKQVRDRKKKNNEQNKELIAKIKEDLLGKTFDEKRTKIEILSIRPSVDGVGFWFSSIKTFSDGSSGKFREFSHFEDYNKDEFIKLLSY
jgi:hypothetical protein